jgi:hypothetical protein
MTLKKKRILIGLAAVTYAVTTAYVACIWAQLQMQMLGLL